ncbi:MAG: hypothetical protein SNJ74_11885 [Fimbriimonadaceae bacterium]
MIPTLIAAGTLAVQGQPVAPLPLPPLNEARFAELHRTVVPTAEELRFDEIDWRPVFWEAVVEAQRRDKPILLWAMNGHPMACT